jgi:hypothetical protein
VALTARKLPLRGQLRSGLGSWGAIVSAAAATTIAARAAMPQLQQSTSSIRKCSNFGGSHSHLLIVARLLRASSPDACSSQLQFSGVMEQLSKTGATCRPSKMSYSGQSTRRLSSTRQKAASLTRRTSFICGYCSLTKDGHARGSRLVGLAENAVQHRKPRGPSLSASTPNSSAQPATAGSPIPQPLIDPEPAKPLPAGAPPGGISLASAT